MKSAMRKGKNKKRDFDARYGTKKDPQLPLPTEECVDCQHKDAPKGEGPIPIKEALGFRDKTCQENKLICCSPLRNSYQPRE